MLKFSIVIPTTGPLSKIKDLLNSIEQISTRKELTEVLVVINGSSGDRESSARHPGSRGLTEKLRVLYEPTASLLAGRHRGVLETSGDVISFVDDDVVLSDSWFSGLAEAFSDQNISLAGGPCLPIWEGSRPGWTKHLFDGPGKGIFAAPYLSLISLGDEPIVPVDASLLWGLNFSIRREALMAAGGFHPDMTPPDLLMYRGDGETGLAQKLDALGATAGYFPLLKIFHRISSERLTLDFVSERAFRDGISQGYSELRKRGVNQFIPSTSAERARLKTRARQILKTFLRVMPERLARLYVPILIEKQVDAGSRFIRKQFQLNSKVREWVLRENYWDWSYPPN